MMAGAITGGDVTAEGADAKVMDFRGFETFLRGMQVEMMPAIIV